MNKQRTKGFTLIELMIVATIVSILAAVAVPAYSSYAARSKRAMAKGFLVEAAGRQERHFQEYKRYTSSLLDLGYPADPLYLDGAGNLLVVASGNALYELTAEQTEALDFKLVASAIEQQAVDDNTCTTLTLTHRGDKGVGIGESVASCW